MILKLSDRFHVNPQLIDAVVSNENGTANVYFCRNATEMTAFHINAEEAEVLRQWLETENVNNDLMNEKIRRHGEKIQRYAEKLLGTTRSNDAPKQEDQDNDRVQADRPL